MKDKGTTKTESYINWGKGEMICSCNIKYPKCEDREKCEQGNLYHYAYEGVEECFKQNRYGK